MGTFLGCPLTDEEVSLLAYESEKAYHGTPSGIDNSVIGYTKPVWFVRGQPVQFLPIASPFTLVIANSGIHSSTADVVSAVRHNHEANPASVEPLFAQISGIAEAAAEALQSGAIANLGPLMNENHQLLRQLDVSLPELDTLVETALQAGALGAKLSGAGRGGNIIALIHPENAQTVADAPSEQRRCRNHPYHHRRHGELTMLTFLKLGGSLITDKDSPHTARPEILRRLAEEIAAARQHNPAMQLIIGHGSGSFGHMPAKKIRHTGRRAHPRRMARLPGSLAGSPRPQPDRDWTSSRKPVCPRSPFPLQPSSPLKTGRCTAGTLPPLRAAPCR